MSSIRIEGELYLSLETVAEVYAVEVVWLREVCAAGLLAARPHAQHDLCIAAIELDRVARIVRLNVALGLDLDSVAALLD